MPSYALKNGTRRWCGQIWQDGKIIKRKWFGPNPKVGGPDHMAAIRWEETARAGELEAPSLMTPSTCCPAPEVPSLIEWNNSYLKDCQARQASGTLREKQAAFKRFFVHFTDPGQPVSSLTRPAVMAMLQGIQGRSGNNAANKVRKVLTAAWTWAAKFVEGFPQTGNPFLATPRYAPVKVPRYVPSLEDFELVLAQAEGQDRAMLLTFLHTGARRGEVFRLTWQDVDFVQNRICLKTRKTQDGSWREDWLPLIGELREALRLHQDSRIHRHADHVFVVEGGHNFANQHEGKAFRARQHWRPKLCVKAGVKPFTVHAIRHLTASALYAAGQPVSVVQAVLRHESPQTTTRYLRTLGLEQTRDALESTFTGKRKVVQFPAKKEATG